MTAHEEIKARLEQRLRELAQRSNAIEDDLRGPLEADSAEQAINLSDDEALAGIDDVLHREIAETKAALLRIEQGTYGTCASCGEEIGVKRLEALPTATRCIVCA